MRFPLRFWRCCSFCWCAASGPKPPRAVAIASPVRWTRQRRQVATPADETPPRDFAKDARDIATRIEVAQAAGNMQPLAGLYLELAFCHAELGDEASRMTALRSAAAYGSKHGPHASHAAARFELAEAAYRLGDLTTACEQWQLARTAYLEDGQMERHASIEKRMRANGCPTDWVLTDF